MSSTLSHFADVKNVTYGPTGTPTSFASVSNLMVKKANKRVQGINNNVVSGPVSSHIVERGYSFSFETNDVSALAFFQLPTNQKALSVLSATWIASETQAGTPMTNQLLSLTQCVIDDVETDPGTKTLGKYKVSGHTLATADDSDQFTMTAGS